MIISPIGDDSNNSTFVGYIGAQKNQTQLVKLRLLLIRLLQSSQLYSPEILLNALTKAGPLDIEKVIVYGRVNRDCIYMVIQLSNPPINRWANTRKHWTF
jgi:hypothetical protein